MVVGGRAGPLSQLSSSTICASCSIGAQTLCRGLFCVFLSTCSIQECRGSTVTLKGGGGHMMQHTSRQTDRSSAACWSARGYRFVPALRGLLLNIQQAAQQPLPLGHRHRIRVLCGDRLLRRGDPGRRGQAQLNGVAGIPCHPAHKARPAPLWSWPVVMACGHVWTRGGSDGGRHRRRPGRTPPRGRRGGGREAGRRRRCTCWRTPCWSAPR